MLIVYKQRHCVSNVKQIDSYCVLLGTNMLMCIDLLAQNALSQYLSIFPCVTLTCL